LNVTAVEKALGVRFRPTYYYAAIYCETGDTALAALIAAT